MASIGGRVRGDSCGGVSMLNGGGMGVETIRLVPVLTIFHLFIRREEICDTRPSTFRIGAPRRTHPSRRITLKSEDYSPPRPPL